VWRGQAPPGIPTGAAGRGLCAVYCGPGAAGRGAAGRGPGAAGRDLGGEPVAECVDSYNIETGGDFNFILPNTCVSTVFAVGFSSFRVLD
jgi:hypothetical protein